MATRDLNARLTMVETGLDELVSEIPKVTLPRIEGWNDDELMVLRQSVFFSKTCQSRSHLRRILVRFYKLYFYGSVTKEDNIVGIVAEASAIARTTSGAVWSDDVFSDNPFYKSPRSSDQTLVNLDQKTVSPFTHGTQGKCTPTYMGCSNENIFAQKTREERRNFAKSIGEETTTSYTMGHTANFRDMIIGIINSIDQVNEPTDMEVNLIQLTGFLALTLWRAATKNRNELSNVFLKTQYKTDLTSLTDWPVESTFCAPCTQCIDMVTEALQKGLPSTASMFILLASEYVKSRNPNHPNDFNARLLSVAVLTDTARDGLEIIDLLERATTATGQKWLGLCKLSYLNITAAAWDLIKQFFFIYLKKDKLQYGYNWARIINDRYLRDYSIKETKEMLPLAGILAGIIERHQGPRVWDEEWAKGYMELLSEMRNYGHAIFDMTKLSLENVTAADGSIEVLIRARQLAAAKTKTQTD